MRCCSRTTFSGRVQTYCSPPNTAGCELTKSRDPRTPPDSLAWQLDFSSRGTMRLAAPILALFCLTFLTAPDSATSTNPADQQATNVNGEVELLQSGPGRGTEASRVVVWLVPVVAVQRVSATTQKTHYRLVQRNKRFEPNLMVVPLGSLVDFPNDDPWFHNVFSLYRGKRFDLGLYQAGAQRTVKFDRVGPSYLFCNIHPGMTGVVLAVESSFFAISDRTGHYSIPDLPPGNYILHVWYENATPESLKILQKTIAIEGPSRTLAMISVPVVKQAPGNHKNKYGQDYDPDRHAGIVEDIAEDHRNRGSKPHSRDDFCPRCKAGTGESQKQVWTGLRSRSPRRNR